MEQEVQKVEEAIDLLNLNTAMAAANHTTTSSNFDLLSGLNDDVSNSFGDFVSSNNANVNVNSGGDLFDPFGNAGINNNLNDSWGTFSAAPNVSAGSSAAPTVDVTQSKPPNDLFADLTSLGAKLNFDNQKDSSNGMASPYMVPPTTPQHIPTTPQHVPPTTPQHQAGSPSNSRPDYSRSHFDTLGGKNEVKPDVKNGNNKPKSTDVFGDLLGSQGYQFSSKKDCGPRTINDMRKEELVKDMDPEKFKILEWVSEIFIFLFFCFNI